MQPQFEPFIGKVRIWKPDLLFKNEETARRHTVLADQKMIEVTNEGVQAGFSNCFLFYFF